MNALARLTKARTQLLVSSPFYGAIALYLRLVESSDQQTMATDGVSLFYQPDFVDRLTPAELRGVIAHEIAHVAHGHHVRRGSRDVVRWNVACDYAINQILLNEGHVLPEGALTNPTYDGLSAEVIYAKLPNDEGKGGEQENKSGEGSHVSSRNDGQDPNGCGQILDAPKMPGQSTATVMKEADRRRRQQVHQAAMIANSMGLLPGSASSLIAGLTSPKVDWRLYLREFMTDCQQGDYHWLPPSNRLAHLGILTPRFHMEGLEQIVVAIDSSSSLDDKTLQEFLSEVSLILDDLRPEAITLVTCDTEVRDVYDLNIADLPLKLDINGRGGTLFDPVFRWIEELGEAPACLIYFTDCIVRQWPEEAAFPVLWASTSDKIAPWGETVQ
ncbi:MAG: VWA-like domain-containing protein, partial [Pseudomonadota bacterium]